MKKTLLLTSFLLTTLFTSTGFASDYKIGFVDVSNPEIGKRLKSLREIYMGDDGLAKPDYKEKINQLQEIKTKLTKEDLSEEDKKSLNEDRIKLHKLLTEQQQNLGKKALMKAKVRKKVRSSLDKVVASVANKQGFKIILVKQSILYSDESADITDYVVKELTKLVSEKEKQKSVENEKK